MEAKKTLFSTRELVTVGLFSALAYVLMLLESPGYLGFLRIEFSDVPAFLRALGSARWQVCLLNWLKTF